jgi:hypothetical protein
LSLTWLRVDRHRHRHLPAHRPAACIDEALHTRHQF